VGLNNIESTGLDMTGLKPQVGLMPEDEVFQTRSRTQNALNTMVSFDNVEDWMDIWARALPFENYDSNDEPIPDIAFCSTPVWWPQNGGTASHTLDVNNSWYVTNDFISLFSGQFLYYRGSIALKVCCVPNIDGNDLGYKFISIQQAVFSDNTDLRQTTHSPFSEDITQLPADANFANGVVASPADKQPVLDVTLPYISQYLWASTNRTYLQLLNNYWTFSNEYDLADTYYIYSNTVLIDGDGNLADALYRKIGPDFGLAVEGLLPPPTLWMSRGFDWEETLKARPPPSKVLPTNRLRADLGRKEKINPLSNTSRRVFPKDHLTASVTYVPDEETDLNRSQYVSKPGSSL